MNPQLIVAAVIAALGFTSGWTLQSWRYGAKETKRAQQILVDQRLTAATAIRRVDTVSRAQSDAAARLDSLRVSASSSRNELDGLRASSTEALRIAGTSLDACTHATATYSRLLNQCGAEYQDLGAVADRHANDVKTLMQAWPK